MTAKEKVDALTLAQKRERLSELKRLSSTGDYSWDFGEFVLLSQAIPEERVAMRRASTRQRAIARRRTNGM